MSSLCSVTPNETEDHDGHVEAFSYLRYTFLYYTIDYRLSPTMTLRDSFAQLSRFVCSYILGIPSRPTHTCLGCSIRPPRQIHYLVALRKQYKTS